MVNGKQPAPGWRSVLGFALLFTSIGWPVLIPVLSLVGVSATAIATFSGVMVVAAEVLMVAGAAVAGKEGFALIKAKVFGFFGRFGPPREVSRRRYNLGLILFLIPIAFGWVSPYLGHHLPGFESKQWMYAVFFDVVLLISLFTLGGAFWEKLQALFRHDARVVTHP